MSHTVSERSIPAGSAGTASDWLTPERLPKVRYLLLGITLFVGLIVWVSFSLGLIPQGTPLVSRLRVAGAMTWLYALLQILDMKVWRSRFAQRRRATLRIPEALEGWLFGQMIAWFGIAYYALTGDARWFAAGVLLFVLSFAVFPVHQDR